MQIQKNILHLQSQLRNNIGCYDASKKTGAVVQLVRIQACHAWGREFESRPHRQNTKQIQDFESVFFVYTQTIMISITTIKKSDTDNICTRSSLLTKINQ